MPEEDKPVLIQLTKSQAELLQPLLNNPEKLELLTQFIDNMLAAKTLSKIVAWGVGIIMAALTAWFYIVSIFPSRAGH